MTPQRKKPDDPGIDRFQFVPLLWAVEFSAANASQAAASSQEVLHASLTLLAAYAALEALAMETVYSTPLLCSELWTAGFRGAPLTKKYADLQDAVPSAAASISQVVPLVSRHRTALTHSEPDAPRTRELSSAVNHQQATFIARAIRDLADALWQGQRPRPVAAEFNNPNPYLP